MSEKVRFKANVTKQRRIHVPKTLFQVKEGDQVIVTLQIVKAKEASC